MKGIVLDLDESTYHAHPALSSTGARLLLKSPAKFHYAQSHPQGHKDAFDLGTAVHSKVLGVGAQTVVLDFSDFRTKEAREAREAARASGLIVFTADIAAQVDAMAESVLAHPTGRALLEQEGNAEASLFATDPDTGVEMRARFDWLAAIGVDLKTTAKEASKDAFERTVVNFGYDVQESWYGDVQEAATGERNPFVFLVVETEPPHLVGVHQLDVVFREMGRTKARVARETFAACTAADDWPGYPTDITLISPPVWAVYQHEERYA